MVAANIAISPFYLPWHQQGVEFLLQENPVPPQQSLCHAKSLTQVHAKRQIGQQAGQQIGQRPAPRPFEQRQPTTQVQQLQQARQGQQGQQYTQAPSPSSFQAQGQRNAPPQGMPKSQPLSQQMPQQAPQTQKQERASLPQEQWPKPWQERFSLTKPARVIWTYENLGHDLCGQANAARRELIRNILKELGHPSGTHSFWPYSLPHAESPEELVANVPVFWSGVRHLEARVLIILGDAAATALGYQVYNMPFKEFRKQDKLVILAKDMDVLMNEPRMYSMLLQYLRPHLRQYLQLS